MAERRTTTAKRIVSILKEVTSLNVVSAFLKESGLQHSASSWEVMLERRILPAVKDRTLSIESLVNLLRDSEECGKQHVFLYYCTKPRAAALMDTNRLEKIAKKLGLSDLLLEAKILYQPNEEAFTDIRYDEGHKDLKYLTVKSVGTHVSKKPLSETIKGNLLTCKYELKKERAVNVIRLSSNGILELRIGSHKSSSNYRKDLTSLWLKINSFFPKEYFSEVYLAPLKDKVWKERDSLKNLIRYTNSTLRNDNGTVLQASSGNIEYDLVDDEGATSSLDEFIEHEAYCDSSNIWFRTQDDGVPSKNIHVLLSGERNEFAVTSHCIKSDYEYVLSTIRKLNS
ncbi:MAG: hypothetical protein JAZ19_03855 [Candidatus Thiodiazotropha taylori]|nr:hypothetical protein [Candidatus Thiodiazotropha taylori]